MYSCPGTWRGRKCVTSAVAHRCDQLKLKPRVYTTGSCPNETLNLCTFWLAPLQSILTGFSAHSQSPHSFQIFPSSPTSPHTLAGFGCFVQSVEARNGTAFITLKCCRGRPCSVTSGDRTTKLPSSSGISASFSLYKAIVEPERQAPRIKCHPQSFVL